MLTILCLTTKVKVEVWKKSFGSVTTGVFGGHVEHSPVVFKHNPSWHVAHFRGLFGSEQERHDSSHPSSDSLAVSSSYLSFVRQFESPTKKKLKF